ncbi:hypothetical protein ACEWY4_008169 [Coilia grayii]|uniref:G-protein coupled receptors family 1 profile domain-containing protein n=1 Tax=Coilia grayii TaxID=363190 RepID=A0ABD1KAB6_9TELE
MNGSTIILTFTAYEEIGPAKNVFFAIIFLIYLASVFTNTGLMLLIYLDTALHKPMYIFLFGLMLEGLIGSTTVWPTVMANLATNIHSTSYEACLVQSYFITVYGGCMYTMLTVMAYDRYVCIFQPLQYHTIMTPHKVRVLLVAANLFPVLLVVGQICLTSGLPLCHHAIHKIFCDNLSVSNLGCSKTTYATVTDLYGVCALFFFVVLPVFLILLSYFRLILLTSKISADARRKAFATCAPHIIIFVNFSMSVLFAVSYNRIAYYVPIGVNIFLSSLYVLIPPLFHPILYGMKNQEIKRSLSKRLRSAYLVLGLPKPKKSSVALAS